MAASPRVARAGAPRVAVVGAGVAGLACARSLLAAGLRVLVYDGARSCGGRVATFQGRYGAFDHGAQYFTVQSHAFQPEVDRWQSAGRVAPWSKAP